MLLLLIVVGARHVRDAGGRGVVLDQAVEVLRDCYSFGSAVIRTVLLGGDTKPDRPGEVILVPENEEGPEDQQPGEDEERVILAPARSPGAGEGRGPTGDDERNAAGTEKAPTEKAPTEKKKYKPSGVG